MEDYAIHVAARGGKIDLIVDQQNAARQAAFDKRWEFSRAMGAVGLYQTEDAVHGLVFKDEAAIPPGWAKTTTHDSGIVAAPKAKDRTKAARDVAKAERTKLEALPRVPGAWQFTNLIGSAQTIAAGEGGRFCLRNCWYHRIAGTTFVMTPWTTKADEMGENVDAVTPTEKTRIAFHPEGCERVPLSAYYLAKEKEPAAA